MALETRSAITSSDSVPRPLSLLLNSSTDVKGATNVFKKVPDVISIFIAPPSVEELGNRLRGRGTESEEVIQNRVAQAARELEESKKYRYVVVNDKLEDAVEDFRKIITSN